MDTQLHILRDLLAGQSTADSTAGRLGIHKDAATVIMERLVSEGTLILTINHLELRIYRLSPQASANLTKH